ncbi:MAG: UDP-N-acetylglucosamine 2-epimerase [Acidobacteriales bacterium]|nr:UDP-N-acetylglucosamine 2-epimerase [Terriglobales bacterium]
MRVVTIVGARPQFIKAAAVSRALEAVPEITEVMIHTGQHYDSAMSDVFFQELGLRLPAYNLGVGSGAHGMQTGRMLEQIEKVLQKEEPDYVLVYGDTNSTLAGALAAAKLHIPVAHVEAGLRSFDRQMPEELNRVVTDHLSAILFAPTNAAIENLRKEGIPELAIFQVGDVMYDALRYFRTKAQERSRILSTLDFEAGRYIVATIHRAENTDDTSRLETIVQALALLSAEISVVLPLHPRTRKILACGNLIEELPTSMRVIEPLGYLDMLMLEANARMITTDSGGVQKEAFFNGVPCVTLRDSTEWIELLDSGWNVLAPPTDVGSLMTAFRQALESTPGSDANLYGNGDAGHRIAEILLRKINQVQEPEMHTAVTCPE